LLAFFSGAFFLLSINYVLVDFDPRDSEVRPYLYLIRPGSLLIDHHRHYRQEPEEHSLKLDRRSARRKTLLRIASKTTRETTAVSIAIWRTTQVLNLRVSNPWVQRRA